MRYVKSGGGLTTAPKQDVLINIIFFLISPRKHMLWVLIRSASYEYYDTLRKHAFSNILKISPPKTERFLIQILIFFTILPKTLIMGTRENRLPEAVQTSTHNLCFWAEVRKIYNVYPCKPQFYYIKKGFKGVKNYMDMFSWWAYQYLTAETNRFI